MAIPDDLQSWRDFVATEVVRPEEFDRAQLEDLSASDREAYNATRVDFLAADLVLETPDLVAIRKLSLILEAEARIRSTTTAKALAISGAPTLGKTTAVLWIARDHERRARLRMPHLTEDGYQPSIYIVTPPATTPKMLMVAFCNFLGLPYKRVENAQALTDRVLHVLRQLRTSLVVVDEIHNLYSNRQVGAEATSTLKLFAERLDAAFIYSGIDLPSSAVFAGSAGQQLSKRAALYSMRSHNIRSQAGRTAWEELIYSCQDLLPLTDQPAGNLPALSTYLFDRTAGSIGRLRTLLRRAAIMAIQEGTERITRATLEQIPTDYVTPAVISANPATSVEKAG